MIRRKRKSDEAIEHVSTAAQLISELIERFPEANGFVAWKAFFLAKKGELLKMQAEFSAANVELAESLTLLESIHERSGESATSQLKNWVESIRDKQLIGSLISCADIRFSQRTLLRSGSGSFFGELTSPHPSISPRKHVPDPLVCSRVCPPAFA